MRYRGAYRPHNRCEQGHHRASVVGNIGFGKDRRTGAKSQLGHLALEDFLFQWMKD
jgi:hypothetical protein